MVLPILPDYTKYPLSALVDAYVGTSRALAMGHAGQAANEMWREVRDRTEAELYSRGFWVRNTAEAHAEALREEGGRVAADLMVNRPNDSMAW